jgi:UDP-N-acetylmuramate--alanine ligase
LGKYKNLKIYTDYAHHPVEIQATYDAFKKQFPHQNIYVIFQPHQLFRFVSYQEDFSKVLKQIDNVVIYDIYSVREKELLKKIWEQEGNTYSSELSDSLIIKTI